MAEERSPQQTNLDDLRAEIARKLWDLTDGELEALERFINESLEHNATPDEEQA